jgi:hypothetical protein
MTPADCDRRASPVSVLKWQKFASSILDAKWRACAHRMTLSEARTPKNARHISEKIFQNPRRLQSASLQKMRASLKRAAELSPRFFDGKSMIAIVRRKLGIDTVAACITFGFRRLKK